ncbi:MAG: XTP/dITP diphosphatase [Lachnospirales bacterium]
MKKIVFATKNKGKLKEIKDKLPEYEVLSMEEAGINIEVEENGETFEENALIKARAISKLCNDIVVADDSGLEIDYLNKAPGVYSARFLGHDTSYDYKNNEILKMLKDVPDNKRTARFVCAMAVVFPNGKEEVTRATIEGIIGHNISGSNGFGYDPIFFVPSLNKTTAELSMEEKNKISHRGKALDNVKKILEMN